jgi:hypothetical protein
MGDGEGVDPVDEGSARQSSQSAQSSSDWRGVVDGYFKRGGSSQKIQLLISEKEGLRRAEEFKAKVAKEKAKERSDRNAQLGRYELTQDGFMPQTWVRQVKDLNHTKGTYETFHGLPLKPAKNDIMPS